MLDPRAAKLAKFVLYGLEAATVVALTLLVVFALLSLMMEVLRVVTTPFLAAEDLGHVLDHILAVFILIELLATAVAYVRGVNVMRRIFEAMLVALARKLIMLDLATSSLEKVGGLALLLVAVGLAWLLVCRTGHRAAKTAGHKVEPHASSRSGQQPSLLRPSPTEIAQTMSQARSPRDSSSP